MVNRVVFAAGVLMLLAGSALVRADMADHLERKKIAGVDVIVYPTAVKEVVTIVGALPAGESLAIANHESPAVARLTAMMLDRGTSHESKFEIAKKLESVGATIRFRSSSQALSFQGRCLKNDLPMVLKLLGEELRDPAFAQDEFEKARKQFLGGLQEQSEQVGYRAQETFRRLVFPEGDPNRVPTLEEYKQAATALTLTQLKAFHREYYGPNHMTLVLVGDVSMALAEAPIASEFEGWSGGKDFLRQLKSTEAPETAEARTSVVEMPGKTSAVLLVGQATGLRQKDADGLPLRVGTAVLGSGFTGRLMHSVRNVEGLTYGIGAQLGNDTFTPGSFAIQGTFAPELLDRGLISTERELSHWWTDGVTAQELAARKTNLIGEYEVGLSDTQGVAEAILDAIVAGRGVNWLDEYPKAIAAVSLEDVNQAMRRHLNPQRMVIVKAGTPPKS